MTPEKVTIGNAELWHGDCRDVLSTLPKVDAVITDPPYGTTQCAWDAVIPLDQMWASVAHVTERETPIAIFGSEPFSSFLRTSNIRRFKYDWIWDKPKGTGFLNAKKQPLRCHELISVFCDGAPRYFPQKTVGHQRKTTFRGAHLQTDVYGEMAGDYHYDSTERYPRSVLTFSSDTQNSSFHPTQKPVALLQYLVLTYTRPDETVLDFAMGSGTAGVACFMERRRFIGIELERKYFDIACERIENAQRQARLIA